MRPVILLAGRFSCLITNFYVKQLIYLMPIIMKKENVINPASEPLVQLYRAYQEHCEITGREERLRDMRAKACGYSAPGSGICSFPLLAALSLNNIIPERYTFKPKLFLITFLPMITMFIIGRIGAAPEIKVGAEGREFITMRVSAECFFDNQRRTFWVDVAMSDHYKSLLPYLQVGQLVQIIGEPALRVFSSQKYRRMDVGISLHAMSCRLVGGRPDVVPGRLYDADGVQHDVVKSYTLPGCAAGVYVSQSGAQFSVDEFGAVTKATEEQ